MMRPSDQIDTTAGTPITDERIATPVTTRTVGSPVRDVHVDYRDGPVKNRVQWGPIIAGTITALLTMLLLAILGLAVGSSAFEPGTDASDWGTGAGIWGAISAIIALFLGGWVAAKTAAVGGEFAGLMNGLMAGAATILILLWLTTTGITNLLGFLGNNVTDIANVSSETISDNTPTTDEVQTTVDDAQAEVGDILSDQDNFDRVAEGAWGTLITLLIALGAAAVGGLIGHNERHDITGETSSD